MQVIKLMEAEKKALLRKLAAAEAELRALRAGRTTPDSRGLTPAMARFADGIKFAADQPEKPRPTPSQIASRKAAMKKAGAVDWIAVMAAETHIR
jgi:hypothetical protein